MQEGLNNVHRYSGSSRVDVKLAFEKAALRLTIRDYGRGIPAEVVDSVYSGRSDIGVGLAGMRERVHELGGEFAIESDGGTCIKVVLPLPIPSKGSEGEWSLGAVS
jgi:signal transduction histidine kinase